MHFLKKEYFNTTNRAKLPQRYYEIDKITLDNFETGMLQKHEIYLMKDI